MRNLLKFLKEKLRRSQDCRSLNSNTKNSYLRINWIFWRICRDVWSDITHKILISKKSVNQTAITTSFALLRDSVIIWTISCGEQHSRPFIRLLPPQYEDGIHLPIGWFADRKYSGFVRPNARKVSQHLIRSKRISSDVKHSHMLMQFGQFLDHDIDFSMPSISFNTYDRETDRL